MPRLAPVTGVRTVLLAPRPQGRGRGRVCGKKDSTGNSREGAVEAALRLRDEDIASRPQGSARLRGCACGPRMAEGPYTEGRDARYSPAQRDRGRVRSRRSPAA